jgi:hypothetical protein
MIELKARCTGNAQDTAGHHTATLVSESGATTFSLPSENLTFIPGNTYKVSIDGEFVKPAPKPTPVKYAGPERRTHYTALAPPAVERRKVAFAYPALKTEPKVDDKSATA